MTSSEVRIQLKEHWRKAKGPSDTNSTLISKGFTRMALDGLSSRTKKSVIS